MIIFGIEDQSTHSFRDRKFYPAVYGIGPFGRIFETGAAKRRLQDRRQFGFGVFSIGIRGEDRQAHGWHRRSRGFHRSEEHTSELQSLMRISSAVFCLKKQKYKSHYSYTLTRMKIV